MNAFYQYSRMKYAAMLPREKFVDELMVGDYCEDGGTAGEFSIRWEELGGKLVPHVGMFDDSWDLFVKMRPLFDALAEHHDNNLNPAEMVALLTKLGFKDRSDTPAI